MLLKTIAYKFASSDPEWTAIIFQKNSAIFSETVKTTRSGDLFNCEISAYCPHLSAIKDESFRKLTAAGALFVLENVTGDLHYIGSDTMRALFEFTKMDGDKPGSRSGYLIKISYVSAIASAFKSFATGGDDINIAIPD
ncbi:MAG: hypothetical protein PF694_09165 [Bacteroidetes bacterium]|nr:hypothetical protein [Bacteroidota bacterium]